MKDLKKEDDELAFEMNALAQVIHADNLEKGFWKKERQVGTLLMLVTSELAEALEADRKQYFFDTAQKEQPNGIAFYNWFETHVKDTFEDELADAVIRLLDLCAARNIDIEWHIRKKIQYNRTRVGMHNRLY